MLTKKLWTKFDDTDIECFCERKKCAPESKPECKEYIVKFIEIERSAEFEEKTKTIKDATKLLEERLKREAKKFETEIQKSIKKMKKFRV